MTGILEAAALVSTLKDASDLVGKALATNPKDAGPLTEMLISARLTVLDLIEKNALLMQQVAALQREKEEALDFGNGSAKYERVQLKHAFVYREKHPPGGDAGAPYLCPKCFSDKKATPLNPGYGYDGDAGYCFVCKTQVSLRV